MKIFNNRLSDKNTLSERVWIPTWKRVFDISLIILVLPLLMPLVLAIAVIIRIVSKGPILFKQERMGRDGQKFLCYKFRTMHVGATSVSHADHLLRLIQSDAPMTKMDAKGDSRIIPFGVILRATGMDELPQLINVLRGEMSIVGPRPCLPYEYQHYLPWQYERCSVAPGLTGLWQVSGKNKTTFSQMIQFDIDYARQRSLMLDLKIIFKTFPVLLNQVSETPPQKNAPKTMATQAETVLSVRTVNR